MYAVGLSSLPYVSVLCKGVLSEITRIFYPFYQHTSEQYLHSDPAIVI